LIGLLLLKIGQVTGLFGRGSGIPPLVSGVDVLELEPHASRSELAPPSTSPDAAACLRKPRLDSRRGSACQPSRGCMPHHLGSRCPD
jgi:hypothetical protein